MEVEAGLTELHNWDVTQVSLFNEAQMEDDGMDMAGVWVFFFFRPKVKK